MRFASSTEESLCRGLTLTPLPLADDIQKGLRPKRNIRTAMAHDVAMYAIVQKEALGLDKLVETAKARMARYQVTPNMLIVPPELLLYIATASEEKYVYNVAGPAGPAKFEAGVAGYEARAFRGCGVVTSTPFEISDEQDSLQMLQRNTQVGEFYRMRAPSIAWDPNDNAKHKNYMDIIIYNEESDMHVHIPFAEALKAACIDYTTAWGGKFTEQQLIDANASGAHLEVSLVIARPFIEHRMMSAVLAVAGADTGVTLFGPAGARRRLSGPCTHFPSPQRSHPSSRLRSQTCRSRRTRRSRRSRAT